MAILNAQLPEVPREDLPAFNKHICPPTFGGDALDEVPANRNIARNLLANKKIQVPGGKEFDMWDFEDPDDGTEASITFPGKLIRTVVGDTVHARVGAKVNTHTIHWHGIEPTPMNDGVGKHSFEISGNFMYQFATRQAGTFFYHCHKNTTLHFERGLYGLLIVDPKKPNTPEAAGVPDPPYPTGGPGFVAALNPPTNVRKYDVESALVFDEIDTSWIKLGHNAFMQKCDKDDPVGKDKPDNFTQDGVLNDFNPDVFILTGKLRRQDDATPFDEMTIKAKVGQTILVRLLNAGYTVQEYRFGLPLEVIGMDGFTMGVRPNLYSRPIKRAANEPFSLTSARRHDLLLQPAAAGRFPIETRFHHWVSGKLLYTARVFIEVT